MARHTARDRRSSVWSVPNTGQPDWDWWGRLWPAPGETLRQLGIEAGNSLVEIGCGNGYFAIPAARIAAPAAVYAVDIDESVLAELRDTADLQEIENLHLIQGDARDLPSLITESVDVALNLNTFHGVDDIDEFVQGVFETLAPGGRFVVVNWHDTPRAETPIAGEPRGPPTELRLDPETATDLVTSAADLELDRQVELPPYHYGLVFVRSS